MNTNIVYEFIERIVEDDIHTNIDTLVKHLSHEISDCFEALWGKYDYEEVITNEIESWDTVSILEYITDNCNPEYFSGISFNKLCSELVNYIIEDDPQKFCYQFDKEPELIECLEFWVVSDWLGQHLSEKGECIEFDFHGLIVWGRTNSGQHISMDNVIKEIAKELL